MNVIDFRKAHEKKLSPMEIEEITNRIKGASLEEKKVMVSVIPTDILISEINRRDNALDTMIDYLIRFSDYISSVDDPTVKEKDMKKFRNVISKKGVFNNDLSI